MGTESSQCVASENAKWAPRAPEGHGEDDRAWHMRLAAEVVSAGKYVGRWVAMPRND